MLKFWEDVHPTLCVTCHVSCVTCHMSPVTCHVSPVTCHLSLVTWFFFFYIFLLEKILFYHNFFYFKKNGKIGGATQWRVCYQRGLPSLVLIYWHSINIKLAIGHYSLYLNSPLQIIFFARIQHILKLYLQANK